jgi:PAS domain S-box-containing protein
MPAEANTRPRVRFRKLVIPLLLLLGGYALFFSWRSYQQNKAEKIINLINITHLSEKGIDTYLVQLSNDMVRLSQELLRKNGLIPFDQAYRLIKGFKERHPELRNVTFLKEDGQVLLTARNPYSPDLPSLAAEPSFQQYRRESNSGETPDIGRPLISVINREGIIPLRYRLNKKESYIISANIPVEFLQKFWQEAPFTKSTALGLMRDDGFLISRYPLPSKMEFNEIYGKPRTGVLINFLKQEHFPAKGIVEGHSSLDEPEYLSIFQRLEHFPITLFLAMPKSDIVESWWKDVRIPYLLTGFLFAGLIYFYFFIIRQHQAREREQWQAGETLRENEEKYRSVFAAEHDAIFLIDQETGSILEVNDSASWLYDYTREEFLKMKNWEVSTEPDRTKEATRELQKIIPLRYHKKKDGSVFPVDISSSNFVLKDRPVILSAIRDVTERQKAEEALRESERYISNILNGLTAHIAILDQNGVIETVNETWRKFARDNGGLPGRTLEGSSYLAVCEATQGPAALSAKAFAQAIREVLAGRGDSFSFDYDCHSPDTQRWFTGRVTRFPGNGPHRVIVVHDNITERVQAEAALRESEAKFRALVENSYDGILFIDDQWTIVYRNPALTRITGFNDQERLNRNVLAFVHPDDRDRIKQELERLFRNPELTITVEYRLFHKNGSCRWMETTCRNFFNHPKIQKFLLIIRDITDRKKMEEERVIMGKLESTGLLAGGIAHDFNNLLAVTLGNLDFIRTFDHNEQERSSLLEATRNALIEAKGLTHQLITLARGGEPIKKPIVLSGLIQEQVDLVLRGSRVTAETIVPHNLWTINADEGQIGQVVRNLVINAVEAITDGGGLSIKADNMEVSTPFSFLPAGKYVRFSITNPGEPIPEEILSRIFDPYFSTKQRGSAKGMGLGLTICRSIIQKHGGSIDIESNGEKGTTVTFYLPASGETVGKKSLLRREVIAGEGRILVMDDEKTMRKMTGSILERLGYEVALVENGEETIESYREGKELGRPFEAVILDLTVRGGMGGKEALRRLLEIDPRVKAIVTSGYSEDPVMQQYREYGFKGALIKPFFINTLSEILSEVIGTS